MNQLLNAQGKNENRSLCATFFSRFFLQQLCRFVLTITIKEAIKTYLPYRCTYYGQRSLGDGKKSSEFSIFLQLNITGKEQIMQKIEKKAEVKKNMAAIEICLALSVKH